MVQTAGRTTTKMIFAHAALLLFGPALALSLSSPPLQGDLLAPPPRPETEHGSAKGLPDADYFGRRAQQLKRKMCIVFPRTDGGDDAPAIMNAFNRDCRSHSIIFLPGPVYHIMSNMTTMHLEEVEIIQYGRMLWSPDINYWRSVSMPVGFQNQTTVWYFGGNRVVWDGFNIGTLDGNGQVWYDWARGRGNLPRRPMNINFRRLTNSVIKRMRFVQSQMWTMALTYSRNVELDDIYVNSTSTSEWNTLNTDGADTIYSDKIVFRRWFVANGDDAIALKGNSSNIVILDSIFHDGQGIAVGSAGQYDGRFEYIENLYARNLTLRNTAHVCYLKTWSGTSRGWPPNGGGGGLGYATGIVVEDVEMEALRSQPFFAWQCENYSGHAGQDCNSSKFKLRNMAWRRVRGTVVDSVTELGHLQCSAAAGGCVQVEVTDVLVTKATSGSPLTQWYCDNVFEPKGFVCSLGTSDRRSPRVAP